MTVTITNDNQDLLSLAACRLCPRACAVDRARATGICGAGALPRINLWQPHYGEEPPISGTRGSGTIFFSGCSLRCVYCQNWKISQLGWGRDVSPPELAGIMLELQARGVHNINLVTATHFMPPVLAAVAEARAQGLHLPLVWNSSGYESPATLRALEDIVDIYLADFRYWESAAARRYSAAPDYPEIARAAIAEMFRQKGNLTLDGEGIARQGLLIRLLVLPGNVNRVDRALRWIRDTLGPETFVSLMAQYYPTHRAGDYPEIDRSISKSEYEDILEVMEDFGFENGFLQEVAGPTPEWTPDFLG